MNTSWMSWVLYFLQFVVLIGLVVVAIVVVKRTKSSSTPGPVQSLVEAGAKQRPTGVLLTPPPAPIDRTEFLQARIAYLAHMRDELIEVDDIPEDGVPTKRTRKRTKKEMIEAINIVNEEHVDVLLDTWDQVQRKQRETSI